jgi:signal transduction histidine kinase
VIYLAVDANGKIYVAGEYDFGYLTTDKKGYTIFRSLKPLLKDSTIKLGTVWFVKITSRFVYFLTLDAIYQYSIDKQKITVFKAETNGSFLGNFVYRDHYYVRLSKKGLMKIEDNQLKPALQYNFFLKQNPFVVALPYNKSTFLIPTPTDGLYLYQPDKDSVPSDFTLSDPEFLKDNLIYTAANYTKDYFVLGSGNTGAVLINKKGEVCQQYNENNLLQSNDVCRISSDSAQNIWFALGVGASKAGNGLDLSYWDKHCGLKGSLNNIIRYKGKLYAATDTKIYYIATDNSVQEVKNINVGQNWYFLDFNNGQSLLAGTQYGIYEIKNDNAVQIFEGSHSFKIYQSIKNPNRIYSSSLTDFISLRYEKGKWIPEGKWEGIEDDIREIIEEKNGEIWMATFGNGIIRITPADNNETIKGHKTQSKMSSTVYTTSFGFKYTVRYYNEKDGLASLHGIFAFKYKGKTIWSGGKGLSVFNTKTGRFELFSEFGEQFCNGSRSVRTMQSTPDGKIWIPPFENRKDDIGYLQPDDKGGYTWVYAPFRRLPEMSIRAFYVEQSGVVWIGGDEGLYCYDMSKDLKNYAMPFNCLVRRVSIAGDSVLFGGNVGLNVQGFKDNKNLKIEYKYNSLKFQFAAPFFDSEEKTLYSYQLVGYDTDWSVYARQTEKEYTNLREGTYTFEVKAKNIYDVESKIGTYTFIILPPWYRTWWAYTIYAFLLLILIQLIVKHYTRRLISQRNHLEQVVKERTLEIAQQKEEILAQNKEINKTLEIVNRQKEELHATNNRLIELDQFKEGMTGMIVHDLKNPLNSILNSNNIQRIKLAGKQMLNMVLNILDVQKFEDAKMHLNIQNHSAYEIAQNASNDVLMLILEKNITFENIIPIQIVIKADAEILERVFVNILTNAVKYTPNNGKITISSPEGFKNPEGFVRLAISDTGQGISADKIHLVFEKFGQVEAKKSGSVRSTGLGLTFCKLAIEAHGGSIGVESELNKGTTFWFTIPRGTENIIINPIESKDLKKKINLTEEEKQILLPLLPELKELEFYEVSSIRSLLKNIDVSNKPELKLWVEEMQNALRAGNEEKYLELLNFI